MFKKFLIIASKKDKAGVNITTQLSQFRPNPLLVGLKKEGASFDFHLIDEDIIQTENIDMSKISRYDFIIFASKHVSEKKDKTLSIHSPGNWNNAEYGGEPERICPTSALFAKELFENLNARSEKMKLKDYKVTLEATHHGPLINKPCLFIEIGSTANEWRDNRAGFIVAKTILHTIETFKENKFREIAFGIGGPHYCPGFNKIQKKSNVAISHVIPQYALPLTEKMIKEATEKTLEDVDFAIIDWKGCGKAEQRNQIIELLEKNYIEWKKASEIKK